MLLSNNNAAFLVFWLCVAYCADAIVCSSRLGDFPIQLSYTTEIIGVKGCYLSGAPGASTSIVATVGSSSGEVGCRLVDLRDTEARDVQVIIDVKFAYLSSQSPLIVTVLRSTITTSSSSWSSVLLFSEGQIPPNSVITVANSTLSGVTINSAWFALMSFSCQTIGVGSAIIIESNVIRVETTAIGTARFGGFIGFHVGTTTSNPTSTFAVGSSLRLTGNTMKGYGYGISSNSEIVLAFILARSSLVMAGTSVIESQQNTFIGTNADRVASGNIDRYSLMVLTGGLRMRDNATFSSTRDNFAANSIPKASLVSISNSFTLTANSNFMIKNANFEATLAARFDSGAPRMALLELHDCSSAFILNTSTLEINGAPINASIGGLSTNSEAALAALIVGHTSLSVGSGGAVILAYAELSYLVTGTVEMGTVVTLASLYVDSEGYLLVNASGKIILHSNIYSTSLDGANWATRMCGVCTSVSSLGEGAIFLGKDSLVAILNSTFSRPLVSPSSTANQLLSVGLHVGYGFALSNSGGEIMVSNCSYNVLNALQLAWQNISIHLIRLDGDVELGSSGKISARDSNIVYVGDISAILLDAVAFGLGSMRLNFAGASVLAVTNNNISVSATTGCAPGTWISFVALRSLVGIILEETSAIAVSSNVADVTQAAPGCLSVALMVAHPAPVDILQVITVKTGSSIRLSSNALIATLTLEAFALLHLAPVVIAVDQRVDSSSAPVILYNNQRTGRAAVSSELMDIKTSASSPFVVSCVNSLNGQADHVPSQYSQLIQLEAFNKDSCRAYSGGGEGDASFTPEHTKTSNPTHTLLHTMSKTLSFEDPCPTVCDNFTLAGTEVNGCADVHVGKSTPFSTWHNTSDLPSNKRGAPNLRTYIETSIVIKWAVRGRPNSVAIAEGIDGGAPKIEIMKVVPTAEGVRVTLNITYLAERDRYLKAVPLRLMFGFNCGGDPILVAFTLDPEPTDGPPLDNSLTDILGAVTLANGLMSLLGGMAATEVQSTIVLGMSKCNKGFTAMDRSGLPLRALAPAATSDDCTGGLVGNAILVVGAILLNLIAVAIVKCIKGYSWPSACDITRFPSIALMVIVFAQNGFLFCGMGVGGDENPLGYIASVWTLLPLIIFIGIAHFVASRAYYPVLYRVRPPWHHLTTIFLPRGKHDKSVLGWGMFSSVVGPYASPRTVWALAPLFSFLSTIPVAVAGTEECTIAFTVTIALCFGFASVVAAARPYRSHWTSILQALQLATNGGIAVVYMAMHNGDPFSIESNLSAALTAMVTLQLALTLLLLFHAFALFIIQHSVAIGDCASLRPYQLSCEWEVANWASGADTSGKGTTMFNIIERDAIEVALRESHGDITREMDTDGDDDDEGEELRERDIVQAMPGDKWILDRMEKMMISDSEEEDEDSD